MRASLGVARVIAALGAVAAFPGSPGAQADSPLSGVWSFNKSLSDVPREIGFNINWAPPPGSGQSGGAPTGGGRGRRGASGGGTRSGGGAFPIVRESYEDSQRVQFLTAEVR